VPLSKLVRPGGIIVIQDCYWAPLVQLTARLPLWTECASLIYQTFEHSGANVDLEHRLYQAFLDVPLPAPKVMIEIPTEDSPDIRRWVYDLFYTLYPRMQEYNLPITEVGELETLCRGSKPSLIARERLQCVSVSSELGRKWLDEDAAHLRD
jgi:hypothetical protein